MTAVEIAIPFEETFVTQTARKRKAPATADEAFGERLARLRKTRGYTQTELGEMLGLSQRMMTYYEREGGRPRRIFSVRWPTRSG